MTIKQFFENLWQAISDAQSASIVFATIIFGMVMTVTVVVILNVVFGGYGVILAFFSAVVARLVYAGFKGE